MFKWLGNAWRWLARFMADEVEDCEVCHGRGHVLRLAWHGLERRYVPAARVCPRCAGAKFVRISAVKPKMKGVE